jgi:hypothetical protein
MITINILLWFILAIINFLIIITAYKFFGKTGLFVWSGIAIVIANIQVLETVSLFGMVATLGNIIYGTSFLITDILSEKYGEKEAQKAVKIGFFCMLAVTLIMQICLLFVPDGSDFANPALQTIFSLMPRIMIASLIAYGVSQFHDIFAFNFWKNKTKIGKKYLWFRNIVSTSVSQLLDSTIFCLVAFLGVFETPILIEIIITTYALKFIIALMDTPFVYWANKITPKDESILCNNSKTTTPSSN